MNTIYSSLASLSFERHRKSLHGNVYALIPHIGEFYRATLPAALDSSKLPVNIPQESYDELHVKLRSTFPV